VVAVSFVATCGASPQQANFDFARDTNEVLQGK
jgi:hypothetical protein